MPDKARRAAVLAVLAAGCCCIPAAAETVVLEAEAFDKTGGWVIDQQFMDQMGSPFLLAHGLGVPVADAETTVTFPAAGTYRVWVRTRDWVWMSKAPGTAGRLQVLIDGEPLEATFGTKGKDWHWHDGGTVAIAKGAVKLALRDLSGFEGRCDAICLSSEKGFAPPDDPAALAAFRRKMLAIPAGPQDAGAYDLVVVGGGNAGVCAAVAAARLGLKVALIQDRPVLGGNNSSEVRVWRGGGTNLPPYPRIGDVDRELGPRAKASPGTAAEFGDDRKLKLVQAEKNIALFLDHHAFGVGMKGRLIAAVDARHTVSGRERRFSGRWFADCTGDGTIGFLAGADWEMTRKGHMGPSNMWRIVDTGTPQPFPRCPWAHDVSDKPIPKTLGVWFWESGFDHDPFEQGEHIRDNNLRGMYGAWDALKNVQGKYPNHRLEWAAYVAGKRESRRLLGDVIVTKDHVLGGKEWPDPAVPCTWSIDLHLATKDSAKHFGDDAFISRADFTRFKTPYWIPYRCLYCRSVENLFMAGRCISVTHEALGTVRVMRTTAMMGEVVGMAAAVCRDYDTTPRGVYKEHLAQLQAIMTQGVGRLPPVTAPAGSDARLSAKLDPPDWLKTAGPNLARQAEVTVSSTYEGGKYPAANIHDGKIDLASNAGRWVSRRTMPQHVELAWERPQGICAARIVTGYRQGAAVGDPIHDFVLQAHDGAAWRDVPGTKVTGNGKIDWHARFAPVTARRLRLLITASAGQTARIWELELYGPPAPPAR
jgi:hypothetical protein